MEFPATVRKTIEKHRLIGLGDRILVGVSGGADSVCLALVLNELGFPIGIAHVNHGLRGVDSDGDESFTAALAQRIGISHFSRRVLLMAGNIEAAGRDARRDFFAEIAAEHGFTRVALAHTRNDRVETFLLNLLRGSGPDGLVSMRAVSGRVIRPLIEVGRDAVEAFLQERRQTWRTDASNLDRTFARNYLRHDIIPHLAEQFNPNLVETLSRTVEILEGEDAWIGALTDGWINKHGTNDGEDFVLSVDALESEPPAMVRRIVRAALRRAGSNLQNISFEQVESVRQLLEPGKSGKRIDIPGGLQATREFDRLVFRIAPTPTLEYEYELKIPGLVHIPEVRKVFRAELVESETGEAIGPRVFVDAESLGAYVRIRNWKPGDYYRPVGLPAGKLKKLFQRARIPRSHRKSWPVVVADSTIVWVASFPISREFVPRGCSQKIVAFEASEI